MKEGLDALDLSRIVSAIDIVVNQLPNGTHKKELKHTAKKINRLLMRRVIGGTHHVGNKKVDNGKRKHQKATDTA